MKNPSEETDGMLIRLFQQDTTGVSAPELARQLGLNVQTVMRIRAGERSRLNRRTREKIRRYLNAEASSFARMVTSVNDYR